MSSNSVKENNVICRCGAIIPEENINHYICCDEDDEDYTVVKAKCNRCGKDYRFEEWGQSYYLDDAKRILRRNICIYLP